MNSQQQLRQEESCKFQAERKHSKIISARQEAGS
jgi:hypothetical protein